MSHVECVDCHQECDGTAVCCECADRQIDALKERIEKLEGELHYAKQMDPRQRDALRAADCDGEGSES
jgi:hypothetical protein